MVKNTLFIGIFLILIILTSCSSIGYLRVQTGIPGNKDLPSDIQSLTLINRTLDAEYYDFAEDTLQQLFYQKRFNLDTILYDFTSVDTTLKVLGDLLFESGRYDIIIPEERFLPHNKNAFISRPMDWLEAERLCNTFNTDAVLSMDYFKTSIATNYKSETLYDESDDRYFKAYMAVLAIQYEALFRVYDPATKKIIDQTVIKDTLWWDDAELSNKALFDRMTSVKDALVESGIAIALDYSDKISTQWRNDMRKYYYSGNSFFEEASLYAKKSEWEQALNLWLAVAEKARGKALQSKAQFNVALAYEMLGDINQAIAWGLKSYESYYRPLTVEYLNILKKRKKEIDKFTRND